MSKIARITQKLFGSTATAGQIGKFGSLAAGSPLTTTDPVVMQSLSNWLDGWFAAILGGNSPAIEDMNAVCYVFAYQLGYLLQEGVAEWDSGTTYYIGSVVNDGTGVLYVSLTNTNLNNLVSDTTKWRPFLNSVYNTILGSAAEVTAGKATHSTWATAIAATSVGGVMQVLPGSWTEDVVLAKQIKIVGSGYGSLLTGKFDVNGVVGALIDDIRLTGIFTFNSASSGCAFGRGWQTSASSSTLIDNSSGSLNFFGIIFPV